MILRKIFESLDSTKKMYYSPYFHLPFISRALQIATSALSLQEKMSCMLLIEEVSRKSSQLVETLFQLIVYT